MPTIKFGNKVTFIPGIRYEYNKTEYTANRADSPGKWSDPFQFETNTSERKNDYFLELIDGFSKENLLPGVENLLRQLQ